MDSIPVGMKETNCLGCGGALPDAFLDLGNNPLANAYVRPEHAHLREETFPLAVAFCSECYLVQLMHRVPPIEMFDEYLYFSSYSDSVLAHARSMAETLTKQFRLGPTSHVLEIASNDGYLLQYFLERGIPVLGVEPASNIAAWAESRGIPTLQRFFGLNVVGEIREKLGQADLVIGNNVLAHVPTINDFLQAVKACLKPTGTAVFEFPYVKELLERIEFDTIYHEHVFYFSLTAIKNLVERAELELVDVSHQPVHGGSLRIFFTHKNAQSVAPLVPVMLDQEQASGLTTVQRHAAFRDDVQALKKALLGMLRGLKASGKRLAACGAPAKGNTLLNYCGIGTDLLEFTVDRSPHKQGLLLPGSRVPIRHPQVLTEEMPDYTMILPWNIAEEIIDQQKEYRHRGGKFIIPIPQPVIV